MTFSGTGVVLIADSDLESCAAIRELVGRIGLEAAAVDTGADALDFAAVETPALVVLGVELCEPSGYEVCRGLRERFGEALPIVFLSSEQEEPRDEIAALLLGADDYFVKPLRADRFTARVRQLLLRSPGLLVKSSLTKREVEVLELLVEGRRPVDIAGKLCITRKTASTHIEHILTKLGAHSQAQAVATALRNRIVELPSALEAAL